MSRHKLYIETPCRTQEGSGGNGRDPQGIHFRARPATHLDLKRLKEAVKGAKDFDPNFDVVAANKWLRDEKRMGKWKWKPPKKKRRRAVKSKKKAFSHKDRRLAQQAALKRRAEEKAARLKARQDELRRMVSVKQDVMCHWQYLDHKNGKTYYCTDKKRLPTVT